MLWVDLALPQGEGGALGVGDRGHAPDRRVHRPGDHRAAGLAATVK